MAEETLSQCAELDFIIRAEPEYTVRELALALRENKEVAGITGLSHRSDGAIIHEGERPWIEELDELPYPAWHLIDRKRYTLPFSKRPFLSLFSSRGCPFSCIFCADHAYYGKKLRKRSPSRIVDEMEYGCSRFEISDFLFWTESFTFSRDLVMEIAGEIMRRNLQVRWYCNSRVDNVDRELLQTMKKAGCRMMSFGIESFSPLVLSNIKKGTTPEQAEQAVRLAHECGLEVIAHCIFGLPGETEQSMRDTLRRICGLPVDYAQFYAATPFPGTEFYTMCKDKIKDQKWENYEQGTCIIDTEDISAEMLNRIRDEAYRAFFYRPVVIAHVAGKIVKEGGISRLSQIIRDLRSWMRERGDKSEVVPESERRQKVEDRN